MKQESKAKYLYFYRSHIKYAWGYGLSTAGLNGNNMISLCSHYLGGIRSSYITRLGICAYIPPRLGCWLRERSLQNPWSLPSESLLHSGLWLPLHLAFGSLQVASLLLQYSIKHSQLTYANTLIPVLFRSMITKKFKTSSSTGNYI